MFLDLFKSFDKIESSFHTKRPTFLHACTTCFELQSNIRSIQTNSSYNNCFSYTLWYFFDKSKVNRPSTFFLIIPLSAQD